MRDQGYGCPGSLTALGFEERAIIIIMVTMTIIIVILMRRRIAIVRGGSANHLYFLPSWL